jgi:hypothetical protein
MEKSSFVWRYTSLYHSYSSLDILSYFLCSLMNLILFKKESLVLDKTEEKLVYFQFTDLIRKIINSFNILQKMMKIPNIIFVMREFKKQFPFLFLHSVEIIGRYLCVYWKRISDNRKISIISSLLYFSIKYIKSSLFLNFHSDTQIKNYDSVCRIFHDIVRLGIKLPNEYPDLISSHFNKPGWTELLVSIFNSLNDRSSSSHSDIPPLFFPSSVFSSENIADIVNSTANTIKMLLISNTPKTVIEYLELSSFD